MPIQPGESVTPDAVREFFAAVRPIPGHCKFAPRFVGGNQDGPCQD